MWIKLGLGTGLAIASAFVALNTFFLKKRGQAIGFSMAGTTLGMMIMPQVRKKNQRNCYSIKTDFLVGFIFFPFFSLFIIF